jgi:Ca2+:H+ antiporter
MTQSAILRFLREEWFLAASYGTIAAFTLFGETLFGDMSNPLGLALVFLWLFAVVLGSCLSVVRHADGLAALLGEPYGTLILTLSVTTIEVLSISAVMLHGDNNPTLVRDTLFSVVMVVLGGMAGLCLLVGGWRHKEQLYNLPGANAYLSVIIPLAVLALVLPNATTTTVGPTLSHAQEVFLGITCIGLYASFLAVQTGRHRGYFLAIDPEGGHAGAHGHETDHTLARHALLLLAYMLPVGLLAEEMAQPIDYVIETLHAPAMLGGVAIAVIVATPESIGAIRAALANRLQLSVNIFLGSVLCTIGLTVPVMLLISRLVGREIHLGLAGANDVLLLLTLAVSVVTFSSGRTNVLQGAVHAVLFGAFLLLIFEG